MRVAPREIEVSLSDAGFLACLSDSRLHPVLTSLNVTFGEVKFEVSLSISHLGDQREVLPTTPCPLKDNHARAPLCPIHVNTYDKRERKR